MPDHAQLSQEDFPRVREAARILREHDVEKEFELGLDAILSGLEANHRRRGSVPPGPSVGVLRRAGS